MDRTHCIINQIADNLYVHPELTAKQANKIKKALKHLNDVYQIAGTIVFRGEE